MSFPSDDIVFFLLNVNSSNFFTLCEKLTLLSFYPKYCIVGSNQRKKDQYLKQWQNV